MLKTSIKSLALLAALFGTGELMAQNCNTTAWGVGLSAGQGVAGTPVPNTPTAATNPSSRYSGRCGLISDAAGDFVRDGSPNDEPTYIARFYVRPNVTTGTAVLFQAIQTGQTTPTIEVAQTGAVLNLAARGGVSTTTPIVAGRWYAVEANRAASGTVTFTVKGNQFGTTAQETAPAVINITGAADARVDQANLGWISGGSGGTVETDAFESRRTQTIGRLCRGDANNDTFPGVQDRVQIVNEILGSALALGQPDVNEDGFVGVADRVQIVSRITAGNTCP